MSSGSAPQIQVGLSWMDHPHFVAAALPLLHEGLVDTIEWSFDTAWSPSPTTAAVLDAFAAEGRLVGHGVTFSVLSADDNRRQDAWLERLRKETQRRSYAHVSEHLGFVTAGDRVDGAPMPLPASPELVRIGRKAVARLADAAGTPIGLENLAFALSPLEVDQEGALLDAILSPSDGFIVLDLHNLWCRAVNLGRDPAGMLTTYPLGRVRELHVSGGSWDQDFRRDTHDGAVPAQVFELLRRALPRLPQVERVVLEQLPPSLATDLAQTAFRQDLRRLHSIVADASPGLLEHRTLTPLPDSGPDPQTLQPALLDALELEPDQARARVGELAPDWVAGWDERAIDVAASLVQRWTRRD